MKRLLLACLLLTAALVSRSQTPPADEVCGVAFTADAFQFRGVTLSFRHALVGGAPVGKPALTIYLHGGSSRGSDGTLPLHEAAVDSLVRHLQRTAQPTLLLVPQCPKGGSWLGELQPVLAELVRRYVADGRVDARRLYLLGASMGGTGTWRMLSAHPGLFAAAMPIAGSVDGCKADSVACTPVFAVMGLADRLMDVDPVRQFITQLGALGAEAVIEEVPGWGHEETCTLSFTAARLNWLFAHEATDATALTAPTRATHPNRNARWYDLHGRSLTQQPHHGLAIRREANGNASLLLLRP